MKDYTYLFGLAEQMSYLGNYFSNNRLQYDSPKILRWKSDAFLYYTFLDQIWVGPTQRCRAFTPYKYLYHCMLVA